MTEETVAEVKQRRRVARKIARKKRAAEVKEAMSDMELVEALKRTGFQGRMLNLGARLTRLEDHVDEMEKVRLHREWDERHK